MENYTAPKMRELRVGLETKPQKQRGNNKLSIQFVSRKVTRWASKFPNSKLQRVTTRKQSQPNE